MCDPVLFFPELNVKNSYVLKGDIIYFHHQLLLGFWNVLSIIKHYILSMLINVPKQYASHYLIGAI